MNSFIVVSCFVLLICHLLNSQKLSKEDILKIPHIDILSPVPAYYKETVNVTLSLYISDLELVQEDNYQFRMYAKLIWLSSWKDKRINDIKDDVYYFDHSQIWSPEIHSYSNEITEKKVKDFYTDTISVKRNGEAESIVFEDYEFTCELTEINEIHCGIWLSGFFTFTYNFQQVLSCKDESCLKLTDSLLKLGNDTKEWSFQKYNMAKFLLSHNNTEIQFDLYFVRNIDIARKVITQSPIILVILLLIQFILPIHSKIRFILNGFGYILCLMMSISLQFEFFNVDLEKERDIGEFYTGALFFITIAWIWNAVAGNIWISCSHDYKPSLGTLFSRIMTSSYLSWLIPKEIVESESYLMKIIFLMDKLVCVVEIVFMIGMAIKMEFYINLWK